MADIGLLLAVFGSGATLGATGAAIHYQRHPKVKVVVAAKRVDNRLMPNYTRAQRRAHKRAKRV